MLAAHVQHFSAGYQQLELGAISQQFPHLGGRSRDLLKVIEEQQHHLVLQLSLKLIEHRSIACFPYADRSGNGGEDRLGFADGGEVNKVNPILEAIGQVSSRLERQTGLSRAARTGQGNQVHILSHQEIFPSLHLRLASDEWCRLNRQVFSVQSGY
jgi:hypothetical protein